MRYTYLFTQMTREENDDWVPVKEKPNEFVFTFGKKIETFLDSPDNTVLLTKDMWKENPATNAEILPTVCFSEASKKGYCRPLIMSKETDKRAGLYRYKLVYENEIKEGEYLSEDIRQLTKTFVNGVKAVNDDTMSIPWHNLADANTKYLLSYIKSYVYVQLLQDKDKLGKARSEDYLKKVLETFFSLIPDKIIEKFDEGLKVHDEIRSRLENVPKDDIATYKAVLKSQNYFKTVDDFNLFVVLRDFILHVKNNFNRLVWVMYRSKIGLVSFNNVKKQLSDIFGFVSKVQDNYEPKGKKQIIEAICSGDMYYKDVAGFLGKIYEQFDVEKMDKTHRAALCYKFQEECHYKYLNSKFKRRDNKPLRQEQFRDLCLLYWGIEEKNTLKPNKCKHLMGKFSVFIKDEEVWKPMRK